MNIEPVAYIDPLSGQPVEVSGKVIKPYSSLWLYFAIIVDNLASGLAGAAFIAFLSSLTSVSFTAVQYAIFSSLMTLTPKLLGGYSGTIVSNIGYPKVLFDDNSYWYSNLDLSGLGGKIAKRSSNT